ncbi:transposase [Pseudonocardia acidicola]|uniref:Tc1-like transposase DDE domain-containing protein n=1 Tax=Pseudonocardia acidicola TaxID=2724939 RepID=A0ABX1SCB2_9PSEU|nr:hypothetical protein [Pseudonocardia acidicola]
MPCCAAHRSSLQWDNLSAHRSGPMRAFLRVQRGWLTVHYLPAYASELNPTENRWASLKTRDLAIRAAATVEELLVLAHGGVHRLRLQPATGPAGQLPSSTDKTIGLRPNPAPLRRSAEMRTAATSSRRAQGQPDQRSADKPGLSGLPAGRRPGRDKPAPRGDHHLGEGVSGAMAATYWSRAFWKTSATSFVNQ